MPAGAGLETGLRSPAMTQAAQLPLRLLSKGPDYLRLHVGCERRDCLSVRERLEADRAKYVKSPSPMPSSKMATVHRSPSPTPISEQKTCCDGNLNLEALNNAINSLQQPAKSGAGWNRQAHPLALRPKPVMYTKREKKNTAQDSNGNGGARIQGGHVSLLRRFFQQLGGESGNSSNPGCGTGLWPCSSPEPCPNFGAYQDTGSNQSQSSPTGSKLKCTPQCDAGTSSNTELAAGILTASKPFPNSVISPGKSSGFKSSFSPGFKPSLKSLERGRRSSQRLSPNSSPSSGPSFHPFCSTPVSFNGRPSSTLGFEYQFGLDSFMCSHSAYGGDKPSTSIVAAKGSTSDLVTGNSSTSENPHDSSGLAMVVSNDADEQQRFFEFCGLEPAFLKSVTATKRASQISEHSVCSDDPALDGLSTRSRWGNADLDADGLEHAPSLVSVVERNARIIKWLYACRQAMGNEP